LAADTAVSSATAAVTTAAASAALVPPAVAVSEATAAAAAAAGGCVWTPPRPVVLQTALQLPISYPLVLSPISDSGCNDVVHRCSAAGSARSSVELAAAATAGGGGASLPLQQT
jgi:hypothetical protein